MGPLFFVLHIYILKIRTALEFSIKVKRELFRQQGASAVHLLPENSIPHLVNLLAHRPQFGEDSEFKFEAVTCHMLLTALMHSTDNIPFLMQLIGTLRSYQDVEKPASDVRRPRLFSFSHGAV